MVVVAAEFAVGLEPDRDPRRLVICPEFKVSVKTGLAHYRPQTNGKAERFLSTMLGGWAYGAIYRSSAERNAAPAGWLDFYDRRRPHGSLSHKPPIARLNELNNLLGSYT